VATKCSLHVCYSSILHMLGSGNFTKIEFKTLGTEKR